MSKIDEMEQAVKQSALHPHVLLSEILYEFRGSVAMLLHLFNTPNDAGDHETEPVQRPVPIRISFTTADKTSNDWCKQFILHDENLYTLAYCYSRAAVKHCLCQPSTLYSPMFPHLMQCFREFESILGYTPGESNEDKFRFQIAKIGDCMKPFEPDYVRFQYDLLRNMR